MTKRDDERHASDANGPALTGETGAQTGFDGPDDKDAHQGAYATTPADDRVGSANEGKYTPVELPSAKVVTGQFDHLATRDVAAMDHALQVPEFEGAETVESLGSDVLDEVTPSAGLGVGASLGAAVRDHHRDIDPNPGYTPPSNQAPPHVSQRPADLPEGETPELQNEVQGTGSDRR